MPVSCVSAPVLALRWNTEIDVPPPTYRLPPSALTATARALSSPGAVVQPLAGVCAKHSWGVESGASEPVGPGAACALASGTRVASSDPRTRARTSGFMHVRFDDSAPNPVGAPRR